jgi:ribonuclease P protein component
MDGGQPAGSDRIRSSPTRDAANPPRVGFVVSKAVGNAVVRHRVARRLRHLMRDRLPILPEGAALVVRALPPAAEATSRDLGADLDATLRRLRLLSSAENGGDTR